MITALKWVAGLFLAVFVIGFISLLILVTMHGSSSGIVASVISMVVGFWVSWMAKGEIMEATGGQEFVPHRFTPTDSESRDFRPEPDPAHSGRPAAEPDDLHFKGY